MSAPARVGAYLVVIGAVLVIAETVIGALMVAGLRRRARLLAAIRRHEVQPIREALAKLRATSEDRSMLARPHRRAWRWYRHPLAQAYRESRRRRQRI